MIGVTVVVSAILLQIVENQIFLNEPNVGIVFLAGALVIVIALIIGGVIHHLDDTLGRVQSLESLRRWR